IGRGAELADRRAVRHLIELAFLQVAARDWAVFRKERRVALPKRVHGFKESVARWANQVVEHEARPLLGDVGDDPLDGGFLERKVTLTEYRAAGIGDQLAGEPVHLPSPDVVGADQVGTRAVARDQMLEQRDQVLVRASADID